MIKVKKGQDPYSVIGQYIRDHVSAIEDMIAVIEIDGKTSNELFMVDMTVDGYFIWKSDWYEGGENVVLIDFFPVSDACNPKDYWIPCSERLPEQLPKEGEDIIVTYVDDEETRIIPVNYDKGTWYDCIFDTALDPFKVIAWMPLPKSYSERREDEQI